MDWNGDGRNDLVCCSRTGPQLRIFLNQLENENHFVQFDLVGTESNLDAIGAVVEVTVAGRDAPLVQALTAGSGTSSQSSKRLTFGLGSSASIEQVVVRWPSGNQQTFDDIQPHAVWTLTENEQAAMQGVQRETPVNLTPKWTATNRKALPPSAAVFDPPNRLPSVAWLDEDSLWREMKTTEGQLMLFLFVSDTAKSETLLRMVRTEERFARGDPYVVAILTEEPENEKLGVDTISLRTAKDLMDRTRFPYRWGVAPRASATQLKLLFGEWFNQQSFANRPFGIMVQDDRVRAFFPSTIPIVFQVAGEMDHIRSKSNQGADRTNRSNRLGGRWLTPHPVRDSQQLRERFEKIGLPY